MAKDTKAASVNKNISWWRTDFTSQDSESVASAIKNEHISMGSLTQALEEALAEKLNVKYVVATTSGSVALLMAMMAIGIAPGDEVIVPNRTWIATAHAVTLLGGKVVLADVLPDKPIMDVSKLESYITKNTKAVIPVPLNGRAVDMKSVWEVAKKHNLKVIEDSAQGLLCPYASGRHYMGTRSDMGCFSFSIAKLLPTGQGGFIATNDVEHYANLKRIRMHGVDSLMHCRFNQPGFNFRITDMQSALGLSQLKTIEQRIEKLKTIYGIYEKALNEIKNISLIKVNVENGEIPIYIEIICQNRDELKARLAMANIETKEFYPNLNTAKHLEQLAEDKNSNRFESQGLTLPSGPGQSFDDIRRSISVLKSVLENEG
ncbi:MAG: DegT/DnrJ/EryC1/StrS family aminotransferase [Candidatus Cloacimonetes bacterium]|nr:DegT/DnrJ/EryC1/StrS family aminotransferase [Candidatus Cloacimonadota bacterium]